jgi:hypothetical protein
MKRDKIKVYILELILVVFLFFTLFASNIFTRNVLAVFMFAFALIVCLLLRKKGIHSIYKKQVTILMLIFSIVYIAIYQIAVNHVIVIEIVETVIVVI